MIYTNALEPFFMMPGTVQRNAARVASGSNAANWSPTTDLGETEKDFFVTIDVPGVAQKDINVSIHEGVLKIEGERHAPDAEKMTRQERATGKFERSFTLPDTADVESIGAKFDLGVLTVSIPKMEKAEPRRIEVK